MTKLNYEYFRPLRSRSLVIMAPPGTNVDDPDNVRRFLAQIGGSSQGSNGINSSTASSALGGSSEMPPSSQSRAMNTADQGLNGIGKVCVVAVKM